MDMPMILLYAAHTLPIAILSYNYLLYECFVKLLYITFFYSLSVVLVHILIRLILHLSRVCSVFVPNPWSNISVFKSENGYYANRPVFVVLIKPMHDDLGVFAMKDGKIMICFESGPFVLKFDFFLSLLSFWPTSIYARATHDPTIEINALFNEILWHADELFVQFLSWTLCQEQYAFCGSLFCISIKSGCPDHENLCIAHKSKPSQHMQLLLNNTNYWK